MTTSLSGIVHDTAAQRLVEVVRNHVRLIDGAARNLLAGTHDPEGCTRDLASFVLPEIGRLKETGEPWSGIGLSLVTAGKYLRSWGLSPQKPIRRAYEQDPEAVARKDKALILWLDRTGLRSDSNVGRGWASAGRPPVVPKTGKRFGVNVMAAISHKGELYFTCYRGSLSGPVFLAYLKRLVRQVDRRST